MIFDTDIFIWVQRGNLKAATHIDQSEKRYLSIYSYMELLQGARNKTQHKHIKSFLSDYGFKFSVFPAARRMPYFYKLLYVRISTDNYAFVYSFHY